MVVLVLTGFPCSGKSTAASMLEDAGYPVVGMGETLRGAIDWTEEDEVWDYAEELREQHGEHGVAVPCARELRDGLEDNELVILEGSRTPAEAEYIEDELEEPTVVCWISADIEARVGWFAAREGRGSRPEDRDTARRKLKERTDREREAGMGRYFDQAHKIIRNDAGEAELANEIVGFAYDLVNSRVKEIDVELTVST